MIGSRRPWRPLLAKELWEVLAGRALWTMLLLECPLIGYSFIQAITLYSEASTAALQSSVLAASLSPLDGMLVPTLGAFYVTATLLFPFVAIRVLSHEKETGALRLLGRVDGFDDDEAKSKGDERPVVLDRFLATERDTLEALELADQLLDAGASPVECPRKESRPVLG
jgi:hypothetical protein